METKRFQDVTTQRKMDGPMASEEAHTASPRRLRSKTSVSFMADANATVFRQPNGRGVFRDMPTQEQSTMREFRAATRENSYSLAFIVDRDDTQSTGEERATDGVRYAVSRSVANSGAATAMPLPQSAFPFPHSYPSSSFSSATSSDEGLDASGFRRGEGWTGLTTTTTTTTTAYPISAHAAAVASDFGSRGPRRRRHRPMSSKEKRIARQCSVDGCQNYTIDRGLCFRHGGGKTCSIEGCSRSAKARGLCWRHGGSVTCTVPGCNRGVKSRGLCWSHGGGTKCSVDGCDKTTISKGLCWTHGGGKRCSFDGCKRPASESKHNFCNRHHAELRDGNTVYEV